MAPFSINPFRVSRVERISCDSESSTHAKENIVVMEKYCVSHFSIVCDDFLLHRYRIQKHNRLISAPKPRTGSMKNGTVTDMHQRVQLWSDLTNPYVKLSGFKRSIPNPRLRPFPDFHRLWYLLTGTSDILQK